MKRSVTVTKFTLGVLASILSMSAQGQSCPPGIPQGGNPNCLPPSVPGSPYYVPPAEAPPVPVPAGEWINAWGAVAVDYASSQMGAALGMSGERAARELAARRCAEGGGKACENLLVFKNQCAAVTWAAQGGRITYAGGASEAMARDSATGACKKIGSGCQVVYSGCSLPVFHRY